MCNITYTSGINFSFRDSLHDAGYSSHHGLYESAFVATIGMLENCTDLYETWCEYYSIGQHNVTFHNFLQFVMRI